MNFKGLQEEVIMMCFKEIHLVGLKRIILNFRQANNITLLVGFNFALEKYQRFDCPLFYN
jgi:hypothetical protein